MNTPSGLHVKTYLAILVIVIFAPLGNVLLSAGMKRIGSATTWSLASAPHILGQILSSGYVWLGIASLLTFFVAYMLVLSWADYSYVQPASSFSYLIVALLGYFFLGEAITPLRWAGVAIICLGVLVVGNTPPSTTEEQ
ncbi:MAG TPA: EamA family transporter [Candidatus Acidoferrum sp.]|jgi:drug/metabolite transporter (DMT)-like permease